MAKCRADWERVELDYRSAVLTLREIAAAHGMSEAYLRKRAKDHGWSRDLNSKIQNKADELVLAAEFGAAPEKECAAVPESAQSAQSAQKPQKVDEQHQIQAAATAIATIKMEHRHEIKRLRKYYSSLITELEDNTQDLRAKLGMAKLASDTLKTLVGMESEAWGFASAQEEAPPPERIDPMEGARRIAFALTRAAHQQATVH